MGSLGPVSNVPLLRGPIDLLDNTIRDLKWVKIPSHVDVEAYKHANTLANGRLMNPLNPPKHTPHGRRVLGTPTTGRAAKQHKVSRC